MPEIRPSELPGPDRLRPLQTGEVQALEALTASALDALIEHGVATAVVPSGSIEHQGAHLPVGPTLIRVIAFVSTHGGNLAPLDAAVSRQT